MTTQHLELAMSRYRRLTVALGQLDPEKHMSQMDNHYLAMGAEISRLQAQVDALADVAEKYLEWAKPMIKDPGMVAIERAAIAALAAAGR